MPDKPSPAAVLGPLKYRQIREAGYRLVKAATDEDLQAADRKVTDADAHLRVAMEGLDERRQKQIRNAARTLGEALADLHVAAERLEEEG